MLWYFDCFILYVIDTEQIIECIDGKFISRMEDFFHEFMTVFFMNVPVLDIYIICYPLIFD